MTMDSYTKEDLTIKENVYKLIFDIEDSKRMLDWKKHAAIQSELGPYLCDIFKAQHTCNYYHNHLHIDASYVEAFDGVRQVIYLKVTGEIIRPIGEKETTVPISPGTTYGDQWQVRIIYGYAISINDNWFTKEERARFYHFDYDPFLECVKVSPATNRIEYYITDFKFKVNQQKGTTTILIGVDISTLYAHYSGTMIIPSIETVRDNYQEEFDEFEKDNPRFENLPLGMHIYFDMRK